MHYSFKHKQLKFKYFFTRDAHAQIYFVANHQKICASVAIL